MHVPLIPATRSRDASSPQETALELTCVTLVLAISKPESVSSTKLFVTITTSVPLIPATRQPENANMQHATVMTTTHVPLIAVTEIPDFAYTLQRPVTITTSAPRTLATSRLENASLKTSLLNCLQRKPTSVSSPSATQSRELFKPLSLVLPLTNVPRLSVTQPEDVSTNLLSVMHQQEEQPTNVTLLTEFANVSPHLVMIRMHVPLIHLLSEEDVLTLLSANPETCVSFQNAKSPLELAHSLIRTAMTVILVLLTLATQFSESVSTKLNLVLALLETLDPVTPPADNVNLDQLAKLPQTALQDNVVIQQEVAMLTKKLFNVRI